jgi:hypothetical protein
VTHPEWARLLLRGLELDDALHASVRVSQVFSALSWRESLAYPADRYLRSDGMDLQEAADGSRLLTVVDPIGGEASYHMAVVRGGDYRMRVRLSGESDEPASAEITLRGETQPTGQFALRIPKTGEWVDAGAAHLNPGVYYASVLLPEGCDLEYIELAPPCLNAVEPMGGWRPSAIAHVYDVALTTLQALDMEYELPPASTPEEYGAEEFAVVEGDVPIAISAAANPGWDQIEARWLRGGENGTAAILKLEIPREGLYTVYAFADTRGGQRWTADSCQKAILCPSEEAPRWWPVLTNRFEAGTHSLAVTAGPGSIVQRVRVVRKKDSPEDYVAALARLGLDLGEAGPISRDHAVDAMNFIEKKRLGVWSTYCGDIVLTPQTLFAGAVSGDLLTPAVPPPSGGNPLPPGGNPTGPPSDTGLPPGYTPPDISQPPSSPDTP